MAWLIFSVLFVILCWTSPFVTSDDFAALSRDTLEAEYGVIKYAGLIFRHGNRIPEKTYPLDPYINYSWPFELGQLTNEGKNRAYNLGKYFEPRYNHLTGKSYNPKRVIMHGSSYDRTLMSGQLFYAGYFPPVSHEIWNKEIKWHPIPVHSTPIIYDNIIRVSRDCPRFLELRTKFYSTSQYMKNLCARYADKIAYIEKHSGLKLTPCGNYDSLMALIFLQDTLLVQDQHKLPLPEWTKEVYPEMLNAYRDRELHAELEEPKTRRLLAGPLLNVLVSDMLNIAHQKNTLPQNIYTSAPSETRPLHLFAGHDTNIIILMKTLNVYTNIAPDYSAALSLELRKKNDEYYVTMMYQNSFKQIQKIDMPNCPGNCTLSDFLSFVTPLIPEDWEAECKIDYVEPTGTNPTSAQVPTKNSSQNSTFWNYGPTTWKIPTNSPPLKH